MSTRMQKTLRNRRRNEYIDINRENHREHNERMQGIIDIGANQMTFKMGTYVRRPMRGNERHAIVSRGKTLA